VFDPADGGGFSTLGALAVAPNALRQAYYDAVRDTTVLLSDAGAAHDVVSAEGTAFSWTSKVFETPAISFSCARILSTVYPVTLDVEAGGVSSSYTAVDDRPFRLRAGSRNALWSFSLGGTGRVTELAVAQSPQELV
jgi:hypothetical protein